ncbi:MAG: hypothetical protein HBSAPP03_16190 [Phycisphaerae bacterium]|nr:MAG: hypothetical protein HBSAPP03_16190 [Phycisphaerae bacterium]
MRSISGLTLPALALSALSPLAAMAQTPPAGPGLMDPGRTGDCDTVPRSPGQDAPATSHRNGDPDWWKYCACDVSLCDSGGGGGAWSPYLDPAWVNPEVMPTQEPPPRPDPGPPIICSYADASPGPACAAVESFTDERSFAPESPGYQGWGWFQHSRPELVVDDIENEYENPQRVRIYTGAKRVLDFTLVEGSSPNVFVGNNGVNGVVTRIEGSETTPELYRYNDAHGNEWTFFGWWDDEDNWVDAHNASGQLWTAVNADGGGAAMYTGHATNPVTALDDGFVQDVYSNPTARASVVYDGAGRRMTYAYTTVNGWPMLASITVAVNSGSWTTVWSVAYTYYTDTVTGKGRAGDLKVITETQPLTSGSDVRQTYFQYYTDNTENSDESHLLKLMVEPDGVRRANGVEALDEMSDEALHTYASVVYEAYNQYGQVTEMFVAGSCGCGGSGGVYLFEPHMQTAVSPYTADGEGETGNWASSRWRRKTVVTAPGGRMQAFFFDEMGWLLASVVGDGSLDKTESDLWVTKIKRDGRGRPVEIYTPEAVHWDSGSGNPEDGSIVVRTGAGLVHVTEYDSSTYLPNAVAARKVKAGSGGTPVTLEAFTYADPSSAAPGKTFGTTLPARLARPLPTSHKRYRSSGVYDETTFSYAYHSGASAWAPKSRTATMPTLAGGDISGPSSLSTAAYFDARGRLVLSKDGTGAYSYTKYGDNGLVTKRVADTSTSDSDSSTAASALGATLPGSGLLYITTYTYDAQGRMLTATLPSGRVTGSHYTKLADGRVVTLSAPTLSSGSTTGPIDYSVHNLAGKIEAQGVLAVSSSTSISTLINSSSGDAVTAVQNSTLAQITVNEYDGHGTRLDETRAYHVVPGSEASTSGCDTTTFGYDEEGHVDRIVDPTGTITRSVHDALGRVAERWVGTNDTGFPGSGNMVVVETTEYDGGGVGNGHVTARTQHANASSGDDRVTVYTYDYRGRLMVQANPTPPHFAFKYDDAGRTLAVGGYSAAPGIIDPTSTTTNRVSLSETAYNTRGQARLSTRHKITQSDGSSTDTLTELRSFDGTGRVIKVAGSQLTKTTYDTLGRATHSYVLASDNDSTHSDATGLSGDYVIEEHQTLYDNAARTGNVLMTVEIARHPLDTSTTGALDAADTYIDTVAVGSGSFKGRAQITSYGYDSLDRQTSAVALGNNGGSTYTRSGDTLPGTRSDTRLITDTIYDTQGMATSTVDPRGILAATVYDALGRVTKTIANYDDGTPGGTSGDEDQVVEYVYTNGLMTSLIARMPSGGDDQTTTYTYGVITSGTLPSALLSNRLLRQVQYPDSAGGSDVVKYAYNRLGQQTGVIDQAGNQIDTVYDDAGRELSRTASTIVSGFDGFVNKIAMAYLPRGPVETVTQYGESGSSTVRDQVRYEYDGWGNLERFRQDVDSAMDGSGDSVSGREAFEVLYTLAKSAPSGGVHTLRRTAMTAKADGTAFSTVGYTYGSGLTDNLSRVATVTVGSSPTTVASYDYLGAGHLAGTTLNQAALRSAIFTESATVHSYGDLDIFNRPKTWDWARIGGGTFYDVDIHYDRNSNPTATVDNVHVRASSGKRLFDVAYTLDNLNRVRGADEGHSTGTAPALTIQSGYHTRNETWPGLSLTGNWTSRQLDADGNGNVTGPNDRNEPSGDQVFNKANEWTGRVIEKAGPLDRTFTYSYDAVGNMIGEYEEDDLGESTQINERGFVYDAFGRMVAVTGIPGEGVTYIEKHRYNGLGFRTMWQYDVDVDGTLEDPERYYFMHDERWRVIGTFRNQDASPKEAFVHHAAGLGGFGGSSYIDSIILRDADERDDWAAAGDGTLEERRYFCQNWRADVVAVTKSDGTPLEYVRYSSYGEPTVYPVADLDMDGDVDTADSAEWDLLYGETPDASAYATADIDFDGEPSTSDGDLFSESYTANTGLNGKGRVSSPAIGNRLGYAGYHHDPVTRLYDVRHRWYFPEIGRWGRRDPSGYRDGYSLYQYGKTAPIARIDPHGLCALPLLQPMNHSSIAVVAAAVDIGTPTINPCSPRCLEYSNGYAVCIRTSCPTTLLAYLQEPSIQDVLSRIMTCRSRSGAAETRKTISIACRDNGESETPSEKPGWWAPDMYVGSPGTKYLARTGLIHELTHVAQRCEQGESFYTNCAQSVDDEVAAYMAEYNVSGIRIPGSRSGKCGQACQSAGAGSTSGPCSSMTQAACVAACETRHAPMVTIQCK